VSIRFLADADLNQALVDGARLREPALDFLSAVEAELEGMSDRAVLDLPRIKAVFSCLMTRAPCPFISCVF